MSKQTRTEKAVDASRIQMKVTPERQQLSAVVELLVEIRDLLKKKFEE